MKLLVIGPQLSGKTTLVKYLRSHTDLVVSEIDEEILKANHNKWPSDNKYKDQVLVPAIYEQIAGKDNVVFFANYFEPIKLLEDFRAHGFRVALLKLSREEMISRNEKRIKHEGYEDATQWLDGQIANHQTLVKKGLVDLVIDATKPTEEIAKGLIAQF